MFLFIGLILENLIIGNKNIDLEKVIEMSRKIILDDFVSKLLLRYNSIVEENGVNLLGG